MPTLSRRQAIALPIAGLLARPALAQTPQAPGVTATEILIGQTMPYSGPGLVLRHHRQDGSRVFPDGQREGRRERPQDQVPVAG
jgi:branched-chain amino acid transport system substrate-binding protein